MVEMTQLSGFIAFSLLFTLEFFRINGAALVCTSVFTLASWIILFLSLSWQQPQGGQVLHGWIPRLR